MIPTQECVYDRIGQCLRKSENYLKSTQLANIPSDALVKIYDSSGILVSEIY